MRMKNNQIFTEITSKLIIRLKMNILNQEFYKLLKIKNYDECQEAIRNHVVKQIEISFLTDE